MTGLPKPCHWSACAFSNEDLPGKISGAQNVFTTGNIFSIAAMPTTIAFSRAAAQAVDSPRQPAPAGGQLRLGNQLIELDRGGICLAHWPDAAALNTALAGLVSLALPVVRYAGGPLIHDLSLMDNLMLESALRDGLPPAHLLPEMEALFAAAGCRVERNLWALSLPEQASPLDLLQIRTGRALMADPDVLVVDAVEWDDALTAPEKFSQAFTRQYPWRTLVWASCSTERRDSLSQQLKALLS